MDKAEKGSSSASKEKQLEVVLVTDWSSGEEEEPQPQLTEADLIAKGSSEKGKEPETEAMTNWPSEEYFQKTEEGPQRPKFDYSGGWPGDDEDWIEPDPEEKELIQLWMEFDYNMAVLRREAEEEEAKKNQGERSPKTCCWDDNDAVPNKTLGIICRHCGKKMENL